MTRALLVSVAAAVLLVGVYRAVGGGDYDVDRPPDPCTRTSAPGRAGLLGAAERVGVNALTRAGCELGVTRERLLLVLAGEVEPPPDLDDARRNEAFRTGLRQAVDEEEQAGRLGPAEAALLRGAIAIAPIDVLLEQLFGRD